MTSDDLRLLGGFGQSAAAAALLWAADEIDRMKVENAALRQDAERYRFIRDECAIGHAASYKDQLFYWKFQSLDGKYASLDAAIDAERKETP